MTGTVDAAALTAWVREFGRLISVHQARLTELDSAIGDADHGVNMDRGMAAAVLEMLTDQAPGTPAEVLKRTGMTLVSKVGGTSGPLYGTAFLRMAATAGGVGARRPGVATALRAGLDGVVARGKAGPGDKTMYDALAPAVDALDEALAAGHPLGEALRAAVRAAQQGRDATVPLIARKGRASYLGERSAGHQDPGATSVTLLVTAAATTLTGAATTPNAD